MTRYKLICLGVLDVSVILTTIGWIIRLVYNIPNNQSKVGDYLMSTGMMGGFIAVFLFVWAL